MHIIIGLIIAFVIVAIYARRNRDTRKCRWRADRSGNASGLYKFHCMACGAETLCPHRTGPDVCHADKRP